MANNTPLFEDNCDVLLRQNQFLEPRNNHSSVLAHSLNFGLAQFSDHNSDLQLANGYRQDLGNTDQHGLVVGTKTEHDFIQQHRDMQNFEENQLGFDEDNEHDADPGHANVDDRKNQLASADQKHGLGLLENHELAVIEYGDFHENSSSQVNKNQELGLLPISDANVQRTLVVMEPPILQQRAHVPVANHELAVGQEFPDVQSCRRALRDAAIAYRFEMQTIKSDKTRFTAKCASEGCPWRIHAAKLPGAPSFTIRTIHGEHTCGGITHLGHQQASVQWVAESMERRLKENPHYKPKEILEEIHRVHGITLSYKQAWRAKERFMASIRGSFEEEFRLLPQYCAQVRRTNPGSIALVYGNPVDSCFERLFISFQASIYGFLNACCPLIGLDRILLKSKYLGTLLFATGFDGDGTAFPLAFGVVNDENNDNWMWFLSELRNLLEANTENMPRLTILSEMQNCIIDAVQLSFPTACYGYSMHHFIEIFRKEFPNTILVNLVWEATHALTQLQFESKLFEIEEMSQEAACWIKSIDARFWAMAYFEGTRFGFGTSSIIESLNTLVLEASGLPIIQMLEYIRRQLMTWFNERRETSMQWTGTLVPSAERKVSEAIQCQQAYQVLRAGDAEFEVICVEGQYIVNVRSRQCSCCGWQLQGLPCAHAVAVLLYCRQNVYRFAESFFTVTNYRKAYSQTIHPIPDKALWNELSGGFQNVDDKEGEIIINPPKSLQLSPGRPRKKRVRPEDVGRAKRSVHCSRCHQTGHFRTTCSVPI